MVVYLVICALVSASVFTRVAPAQDIYWIAEGGLCQQSYGKDRCIHYSNCLPNKDGSPPRGYSEFCNFSGMTSILCCKLENSGEEGLSFNYTGDELQNETATSRSNRIRRNYPDYFFKWNISLVPNNFKELNDRNYHYWPYNHYIYNYPLNFFLFINFKFGPYRSSLPTSNNQSISDDKTSTGTINEITNNISDKPLEIGNVGTTETISTNPPNTSTDNFGNSSVSRFGLDVNTTADNAEEDCDCDDENSSETFKKIEDIFKYDYNLTTNTESRIQLPQNYQFISPRQQDNNDNIGITPGNNNGFRRTINNVDAPRNSIEHFNGALLPNTTSLGRCVEFFRQAPLLKKNHASVVGGRYARPNEFPHLALLGYGQPGGIKWLCTGALISENYVITAANCVIHKELGKVRNIRLGEFDLTSTTANSNRRDFSVVETITHPSFKSNSFYHDIGLIRLNESVGTFNNYIRPICLPTGSFKDNADIVVPAWRLAEAGRSPSNMLQRVELTQLDDERCKRFYGTTSELNNGVLQEIQFCAYANDAKQDVCYGDIGGPLHYINHNDDNPNFFGFLELVGITGFDHECSKLSVVVYTRVLPYVQWIESIVFRK